MSSPRYQSSDQTPATKTSKRFPARRAAEHGNHKPAKALKTKYVGVACNDCKRRKTRCSGGMPCERCAKESIHCAYALNGVTWVSQQPEEIDQMSTQIKFLLDRVDVLLRKSEETPQPRLAPPVRDEVAAPTQQNKGSLEADYSSSDPSPDAVSPYCGPTTAAFAVERTMLRLTSTSTGTTELFMPRDVPNRVYVSVLGAKAHDTASGLPAMGPDPLWQISHLDALRLFKIYEETIGTFYPVADMQVVAKHSEIVFKSIEGAKRLGFAAPVLMVGRLTDDDVILRIILALSLITEQGQDSEMGRRLLTGVQQYVCLCFWKQVTLKQIVVVAITSCLFYVLQDEVQAQRLVRFAASSVLEIGLQHKEVLLALTSKEDDASWLLRLFWSVYLLDRRLSFGVGAPFSINDVDIDPALPNPDASMPYLHAMIQLAHISSKVWYAGAGFQTMVPIKREELNFLDFQVLQWRNYLPSPLQLRDPTTGEYTEAPNKADRRIQYALHLRANRIRTQIYQLVLQSAAACSVNEDYLPLLLEAAKDTINTLARFSATTNIDLTDKVLFYSFVVSAMAALVQVASQQSLKAVESMKSEFMAGMTLMKVFSSPSILSNYYSVNISTLQRVGSGLGLLPPGWSALDASSDKSLQPSGTDEEGLLGQDRANESTDLQSMNSLIAPSNFQMLDDDDFLTQFEETTESALSMPSGSFDLSQWTGPLGRIGPNSAL